MCQAPAPREEGPGWEEIHTYAPLLCRVAKLKTVASGSRALPQVIPCVQQKEPSCVCVRGNNTNLGQEAFVRVLQHPSPVLMQSQRSHQKRVKHCFLRSWCLCMYLHGEEYQF